MRGCIHFGIFIGPSRPSSCALRNSHPKARQGGRGGGMPFLFGECTVHTLANRRSKMEKGRARTRTIQRVMIQKEDSGSGRWGGRGSRGRRFRGERG